MKKFFKIFVVVIIVFVSISYFLIYYLVPKRITDSPYYRYRKDSLIYRIYGGCDLTPFSYRGIYSLIKQSKIKNREFLLTMEIKEEGRTKCFQLRKLNGIDYKSFEVVGKNSFYIKDKNNVYFDQSGLLGVIEGANAETFDVFKQELQNNCYAYDKNHIYWRGTKVKEADKMSFEVLGCNEPYDHYGKDKNYIFSGPEKIKDVDHDTFSVIYDIPKDKNNVYFQGKIIEKADAETYGPVIIEGEISRQMRYTKDKNYVYYDRKIINGVDSLTFKMLSDNIYLDKNNVYYDEKIINDANPLTFQIIYFEQYGEKMGTYYQKDKNNVYFYGKKINNADSFTFSTQFNVSEMYYAKDKNNVYYDGKIVEKADPNTFLIIARGQYAKDKNFYFSTDKIIEKSNPLLNRIKDIEVKNQKTPEYQKIR